ERGVEVDGRAAGHGLRGGDEELQDATEHDRYVTGPGRVVAHVHVSPPVLPPLADSWHRRNSDARCAPPAAASPGQVPIRCPRGRSPRWCAGGRRLAPGKPRQLAGERLETWPNVGHGRSSDRRVVSQRIPGNTSSE